MSLHPPNLFFELLDLLKTLCLLEHLVELGNLLDTFWDLHLFIQLCWYCLFRHLLVSLLNFLQRLCLGKHCVSIVSLLLGYFLEVEHLQLRAFEDDVESVVGQSSDLIAH